MPGVNCCQGTTAACSGCRTIDDLTSTPPSTIQVVIQGTTLCTTCTEWSGPIGGLGSAHMYGKVASGVLDGVYCATLQTAPVNGECVWTVTLPSPVVVSIYGTNDCLAGVIKTVTIDTLRVVAVKTGTFGGYPNNYDTYPQQWPTTADTSNVAPLTQPMNFMVTLDTTFIGLGSIPYTIGLFTGIQTGYPNCININSLSNIVSAPGLYEWYWQGVNASTGQGHLGYMASGGTARVTMNECICEGAQTISATISGVTLCSCGTDVPGGFCNDNPATLHDMKNTGTSPNGTYCLTKTLSTSNFCQYTATVPVALGQVFSSTNGTCTGTICYSQNFNTLTVTVTYTNNVATSLDIRITPSGGTSANVVTFWAATPISAPSGAIDGTYTGFSTSCGAISQGFLAGFGFASGGNCTIAVNGC